MEGKQKKVKIALLMIVGVLVVAGAVLSVISRTQAVREEQQLVADAAAAYGNGRYLIINADDFGMSDGVTDGIIKAWQAGVVTSTSAMINMDGAVERIQAARAAHPDLPIGLHLNITVGKPVTPPSEIPTLVDEDGNFYTSDELVPHLVEVDLNELEAELRAQAELMITNGVMFDHIDYHQHMLALYTPFYPIVRELALEYGVPVRQPVPVSVYGIMQFEGGGSAAAMQEMMRLGMRYPLKSMRMMPDMLPGAFKRQALFLAEEGIPTSNWFVDGYYGNPGADYFIQMIQQLPAGVSEIMVHPAELDEGLVLWGGDYIEQREMELAALLDPAVRAALAEHNVQLIDYGFISGN
ncbi:MAG: ChbG/HpnK family deacetylase [Anaerolineae bacterium]|nr:ChbG/HpnK family deacetylase [Anaerolineae bacterium]